MAYVKKELTNSEWTLIGSNVTEATFQVIGQWPAYINFSSSTTPPTDEVGLYYKSGQGELKKSITDMTAVEGTIHIFAKAVSGKTNIIVIE